MSLGYWQTLITAQIAGGSLVAAAAASMIPAASKFTLPANFFQNIGQQLIVRAQGGISCAVTSPGTARFDVRFGGTVVADSQAINLNIVAKANVNWLLEFVLTCQAIGAAGNLMVHGTWMSEAVIGSPLPTAGGSGVVTLPYNAAGAVGNNFDTTAAQQVDLFFTQTVATGTLVCRQYALISPN